MDNANRESYVLRLARGDVQISSYNPNKTLKLNKVDNRQNKGGLLGGLSYVGASLGAGIGGVFEGIGDLAAAGTAAIQGKTDLAKTYFLSDDVGNWHREITEEYNPSGVMQFIGDVSQGVGQSSAFLLNAIPGMQWLGTATFFTGTIGKSIGGAAQQTGDVGVKEVGYGITSGAIEGGLEVALGAGAKAAKHIASSTAKSATKSAVRRGLTKKLLTEAGGEFLEEALSEVIDVGAQRLWKIDENASTTWTDVLRAGAVGFFSGGLMSAPVNIANTMAAKNQGAKIIKNGNADTLVRTATVFADEMAGKGTNFKNTSEYIKNIRADVDAYNKLSANDKTGAKGQTILGELQANLAFAERNNAVRATRDAIINNSSESELGALAEYLSGVTGKKVTVEDIRADKNDLATQLAILNLANGVVNEAQAAYETELNIKRVSEEEAALKREQNGAAVVAQQVNNDGVTMENTVPASDPASYEQVKADEANLHESGKDADYGDKKYSIVALDDGKVYVDASRNIITGKTVNEMRRDITRFFSDLLGENPSLDIHTIEGDVLTITKAQTADKARDNYQTVYGQPVKMTNEEFAVKMRIEAHIDEIAEVSKHDNIKSDSKNHNFAKDGFTYRRAYFKDFDGKYYEVTLSIGNNGTVATIYNVGQIKEGVPPSANVLAVVGSKPLGSTPSVNSISQKTEKSTQNFKKEEEKFEKGKDKKERKHDLKDAPENSFSDEVKEKSGSVENENDAKASGEKKSVKDGENKESSSRKNESDKETAEQSGADGEATGSESGEENAAPKYSAQEKNKARDYVKGFDELSYTHRNAILGMIRTAASNGMDERTVRSVANIMAIDSTLEVRFDKNVSQKGLYTRLEDGRYLVMLNPDAEYKQTVKKTIVHELVHYLENKPYYAELKKLALDSISDEQYENIKKQYEEYYKKRNIEFSAEELKKRIDSEAVARLVGDRLGNERFLKRYANLSKGNFKRTVSFIGTIVDYLRTKDKDAYHEASKIMRAFDKCLISQTSENADEGKKYSIIQKDGKYFTPTDEEIIKKHPTISAVAVDHAKYTPGVRMSNEEYRAYRKTQSEKAEKNFGVYTNKDTAYSQEFGEINAEFGNSTTRKANSYGGIALLDILPYIPQIYENAIVLDTKPDSNGDTNIKGIVDLVGCATLNDKYLAIVKLNVKEYANDEAKIYDNRVLTIEELTVVERVGHQDADASGDSTSSAVSSKYIIARFRDAVNNGLKKSYDLSENNSESKAADSYFDEAVKRARMREMLANEQAELKNEEQKAAKKTNAVNYTKKEITEAITRIKSYIDGSVSNELLGGKETHLSLKQKNQFISDLYIAMHNASEHGRNMSKLVSVIASNFAKDFADKVYFEDEGGRRQYLSEIFAEDTMQSFSKDFEREILKIFRELGSDEAYGKFIGRVNVAKEKARQSIADADNSIKAYRNLNYEFKKLRQEVDMKKRFAEDEAIYSMARKLSRIANEKGQFTFTHADEVIREFYSFLTEGDRFSGFDIDGAITDFSFDMPRDYIGMIEGYLHTRESKQGKHPSSSEAEQLSRIIAGARGILRNLDTDVLDGQDVSIEEMSRSAINDLKSYQDARQSRDVPEGVLGKLLTAVKSGGELVNEMYFRNILTPEVVFSSLEGYSRNGILRKAYRQIRDGTQLSEKMKVEFLEPFVEFIDVKGEYEIESDGEVKSKKITYRQKLAEKQIKYIADDSHPTMSLGEAIYLYMVTKRSLAEGGLENEGIIIYDQRTGKPKLKIDAIPDVEFLRGYLYSQFDEGDKQFIKLAENFFNVISTETKKQADIKYWNYSNVISGYYVPLIRDRNRRQGSVTDSRINDITTVYNEKFNQHTSKNKIRLEVRNIFDIIENHAKGLADYANLYQPLKFFDRLLNKYTIETDADGNEKKGMTLREYLNTTVWAGKYGADSYLKNLFADIQGSRQKGFGEEFYNKVFGKWVSGVLGLNPKVCVTQLSSYVAASQIIKREYLARATAIIGKPEYKEMAERADKYSKIIKARSFDSGAVRAQTNTEKIGEFGKMASLGIEYMDRNICLVIYHAAELQAEAEGKAIGTRENAVRAAEIADEAIYTTQAMTSPAERSAMMRSPNLLAKNFTMFTSDAMKQFSYGYDSLARLIAHTQRKNANQEGYTDEMIANDKKNVRHSFATIITVTLVLTAITQGFKYLYAQEEEEPEDKALDIVNDFASQSLGMLPVISDVYDKLANDYDMSNVVFDTANSILEDIPALTSNVFKAAGGEFVSVTDIMKPTRSILKTTGNLLGVPFGPFERMAGGLLRRFDPVSGYVYDSLFYTPSYTADLKEAVEKGDERLASHIISSLYKNEGQGIYASEELTEVARLYGVTNEDGEHLDVLPQKIPSKIGDVTLTRRQRTKFQSIYEGASAAVMTLISNSAFDALDDEQRAKAIKNTYKLYYNRAATEVAGEEWSNAQAYSMLLDDTSALFIAQAYKSGFEKYTDESGNKITVKEQFTAYLLSLGLDSDELTIISYANGIRDKATKSAFIEIINKSEFSGEEKQKIATQLNFEYRDGVVSEKKEE